MTDETTVVDLFKPKEDKPAEPNFHYTIAFRDHDWPNEQATGYIILGHGFYGVARGDGILYNVWPTDVVLSIVNNGPISTTVN